MNFEYKGKKKHVKLEVHWMLYFLIFLLVLLMVVHPYFIREPEQVFLSSEQTEVVRPTYEVHTVPGRGVCITDEEGSRQCYEDGTTNS